MTEKTIEQRIVRIRLAESLSEVHDIVQRVESIVHRVTGDLRFEVRLFGSWASGNPRPHSDIDIAIDGPRRIDPVAMAEIRDACERIPTLFTFDLVDLAAVSEAFRRSVREQVEQSSSI